MSKLNSKITVPISVCVTTKNNEDTIEKCLSSVYGWVDEIVVVDSQSTDETIHICEKYDSNIYQKEFHGFGDIKESTIQEADNDWVLILDADEWVSEDLKEEIVQEYNQGGFKENHAYLIKKKNKMFGRWMHIDHPERPLLAEKDSIYYRGEYIHEHLSVKDESVETARLTNKISHVAYDRVSEKIEKINQYASLQALQYVNENEPNRLWFMYRSIGAFFYYYVYSKGILDGYQGFIYAILESAQVLLCYQKMSELKNLRNEVSDWEETWLSLEGRR
ncbi:glycosyltransferase family 2 protein [Haloferax volcanii]|uniref:glycosyltransferase family 2 protein n=1 Tax=Haloferax volcanii TaxID=2246 RepID=UPI00385DCE2D